MLPALLLLAALAAPADDVALIGPNGVLQWQRTGEEVRLFGVNYYPMFYGEYQEMTGRGLDIRKVIEDDLDQFVRLGFTLVRLHCFDREFSDAEGGIVANERLALLDHLVAEAKERGIYIAFTPIAWWPTVGDIGGFSGRFPMAEMVTKPESWAVQGRFLREFLTHRNPETGLPYGEDPGIVALETINEPIPPAGEPDETVTRYIDSQVEAIRSTGCTKPVFYNAWGGRHAALKASKADGSSFNWYPTGLQSGAALTNDCLGLVDRHPEAHDPILDGTPKMVYEFDCADVPTGELYPAMARSFRAAGIQLATQFQYETTPCAPHNRWWVTHFLSLPYAPQRAMAMAVAAEAFRRLPAGGEWGVHPARDRFGDFRVDHATGLSQLAAEDAFLYSASTADTPPAPERLTRIAGVGSSPLVQYDGTGAYFLDRQDDGAWRLEVWPDCVWVDDPFHPNHPNPEASRVYWRERHMAIALPAFHASFDIRPGVWRLREGAPPEPIAESPFPAPPEVALPPVARVSLAELLGEGQASPVSVRLAGPGEATEVTLRAGSGEVSLERVTPYEYRGTIPAESVVGESLPLRVQARFEGRDYVFPGGTEVAAPTDEPLEHTLLALEPGEQLPEVAASPGVGGAATIVEGSRAGTAAMRMTAERFGAQGEWAGIRLDAQPLPEPLRGGGTVLLRARRTTGRTWSVELALVMADGTRYGCPVTIPTTWGEVAIPLTKLFQLDHQGGPPLDLTKVAGVTLGMGPYTLGRPGEGPFGYEVESVRLLEGEPEWRVPIQRAGAPFVLVEGGIPRGMHIGWQEGYSSYETQGADGGRAAWGLEAKGFPGDACLGAQIALGPRTAGVSPLISDYGTVHLRVRGARPATTRCEIGFREMDGTAWGTEVPLSGEWTDLRLPLTAFRHFAHWGGTPEGRGGEGDHLLPGEVATVHVTFGAWLYPGKELEPHAVEIDFAALEP